MTLITWPFVRFPELCRNLPPLLRAGYSRCVRAGGGLPVDAFECGVFDGFEAAPRIATMDDLGLKQSVDSLCESIVTAVTDVSDRRFDPCRPVVR